MVEVTKSAIERLEKTIKSEGHTIENTFLRLYMAAG